MVPDAPNPESGPPPRPTPRRRTVWGLALVCTVVGAAGFAAYRMYWRDGPPTPDRTAGPAADALPPDPRLAYQGPFHNVRPDVRYVGDAVCAECHADITRTYAAHPMGRSAFPVARAAGRPPTDPAHNNPFEAFGIQFRVDEQGDRVYHRQTRAGPDGRPVYEFAHEADVVIGSGARGHSYLTVRDGFVLQTPISWFSQKQLWDLSPGFPPWARAGRLIQGACLHCHVNQVEPVEGTRNRYHEPVFRGHAIGCERCHGPGELHARSGSRDDIVDPKRLEPELREAVCQQCHLEGATRVVRRGRGLNDFRPGMPLQDFFTVFVRAPRPGEAYMAVSHVEQMYESACFRRSPADRKLGCTSCHNPHEAPAPEARVAYYRGRCSQCHTAPATECRVPEPERRKTRPDDSCVACHMPRAATADVAHTASTDHRVIRKPGAGPTDRPRSAAAGEFPLLDFHRGPPDLHDAGLARDLGVALYQLSLKGVPLTERDGEFAVRLLDQALAEYPADIDALEAKGKILETIRRPYQAVPVFEAVLRLAPRHETALVTLGAIYRDLGLPTEAAGYWRRAVEVNPWVAEYRKNLATQLAATGAWEEAEPHCRRWLELDPASTEARCLWVQYLLQVGRKAEAAAEYAKVRALRPPDLARLDAWFLPLVR